MLTPDTLSPHITLHSLTCHQWLFLLLRAYILAIRIKTVEPKDDISNMSAPGAGHEYPPEAVTWLKRDVLLFATSIGATVDELHFLFVSTHLHLQAKSKT